MRLLGGWLRAAIVAALYGGFALLPVAAAERGSLCVFFWLTGRRCATCGVTRAFCNIMHGDLARAFEFNSVFTTAIFPLFTLVALEDIFNTVYNAATRGERRSLLQRFFDMLADWR